MENAKENSKNSVSSTEKQWKPADFCFHIEVDTEGEGDTIVFFTDNSFFEKNNKIGTFLSENDKDENIAEILADAVDDFVPDYMDELACSCYGTSRSAEEVRTQLLTIGFVENTNFSNFMSSLQEKGEN